MPRKPRIDLPGLIYHVISRGNNGQQIFFEESDFLKYLEYLKRAKSKYPVVLFTFVLMPNHVHLLVRRKDKVPLGKFMQALNTGYTVYFNLRYQRAGHLFQGRYKSILVEEETHFLQLLRYVHYNPVRAGLADKVDSYPYSSIHRYLSFTSKGSTANQDDLIDKEEVLQRFGKRPNVQARRLKEFLFSEPRRYDPERYLKKGFILGGEEFEGRVMKILMGKGEGV